MDKFFIIVILILVLISFSILSARKEGRDDKKRLEDGKLSVDDFKILE